MPDIDFQKIELNLIPKKGDDPVIFYASQYETARPFIAVLKWGDTEFAPGDDSRAEIDIRKNDDNLVVITDDVVIDNNEVSVILPVQALTCIGKNLGQVKIYADDDQLIAALNFILEVQADPLTGGVTSETAIDNLTQQIEDIATEVIGEDYYDKTEVDALLADKADVSDLPDMTQYYTKTQTDTLLNGKADASTTYTKTEVDNALALKVNSSDLATVATTGDYDDLINKPVIPAAQIQSDYTQADTTAVDYIKNKPDISGMIEDAIFNILPVDTASGNPCSFETEIAAKLTGLETTIVAQGGGGTPSTPIPIVGYSDVNFTNEDDNHTELDSIIIQLGQTVYGGYITKNVNGNWVLTVTSKCVDMGDLNWTFHASGSTAYNYFSTILDNVKFVQPLTVANAICSMFPFVTSEQVAKTGYDETIAIGGITCFVAYDHYTDVGQFITAVTGQKLVFELATPFTIDLSSSDMLDAVVGKNNVFSDCGVTTARYKDSIQHYIDTRI